MRDQAKTAFAEGDDARGHALLGESLKASADFEQRVVLQPFYDADHAEIGKSLSQSLMTFGPDGFYNTPERLPEAVTPEEKSAYAMALNPYAHALPAAANGVGDVSRQYLSTVSIDGRSVSFTGRDIGNVDERMPFVYDIAQAFMSAVSAGSTNGLSAQQRVYQDQRQMIQRVWGTEVWRQDPRRATTPQR